MRTIGTDPGAVAKLQSFLTTEFSIIYFCGHLGSVTFRSHRGLQGRRRSAGGGGVGVCDYRVIIDRPAAGETPVPAHLMSIANESHIFKFGLDTPGTPPALYGPAHSPPLHISQVRISWN